MYVATSFGDTSSAWRKPQTPGGSRRHPPGAADTQRMRLTHREPQTSAHLEPRTPTWHLEPVNCTTTDAVRRTAALIGEKALDLVVAEIP